MSDPLSGEPEVPVLRDHEWWEPDEEYVFGDDPDQESEGNEGSDAEAG